MIISYLACQAGGNDKTTPVDKSFLVPLQLTTKLRDNFLFACICSYYRYYYYSVRVLVVFSFFSMDGANCERYI